ncbi:MAG TPA: iron-sulfur cluster assembly accessory protein [Firmicutes bacterium]|nr:iron-sulfur cluster assembly accessory protein [Bacillota bacterium]
MTLDESTRPNDSVHEIDGIKFVLDPAAARFLDGATVDYRAGWFGHGFSIYGPGMSCC